MGTTKTLYEVLFSFAFEPHFIKLQERPIFSKESSLRVSSPLLRNNCKGGTGRSKLGDFLDRTIVRRSRVRQVDFVYSPHRRTEAYTPKYVRWTPSQLPTIGAFWVGKLYYYVLCGELKIK